MAIITYSGTIKKGVSKTLTLHKADLSALIPDDYYADPDNWSEVKLYYKSAQGNQSEDVTFDCTAGAGTATATGPYLVSAKSLDLYIIDRLEIKDYDNGVYPVPRFALPVTQFDVNTYQAPLVSVYSHDFIANGMPVEGGTPEIYWVGGDGTIVSNHLHLDANEFFGIDFYIDGETRSLELEDGKEYTLRLGIGAGTVLNTSTSAEGQLGVVGDIVIDANNYFPITEAQRVAINALGVGGGQTIDLPVTFSVAEGNFPSIGIDTYAGSTMNIFSIELLG